MSAPLKVCRAHELAVQPPEEAWLVQDLWADQAVGLVGGEPKCCKSFLALDMVVAVAAGTRCLGRFAARRKGPVLLFAAEDALHVVRRRLEGIAAAAGVDLEGLDIHVITEPVLRLDVPSDRQRLKELVQHLGPVLLVLDPFVRLHRVDENAAAEVAPLLAYLRELQRDHGAAVLLVHHARKGAGARTRAGQALRGSSELHAWGDSNLYLRRKGDELLLSIEHRAAPSQGPLALQLCEQQKTLALRVLDGAAPARNDTAPTPSRRARIEQALKDASGPLSLRALRAVSAMRMDNLRAELDALAQAGGVLKDERGYRLAAGPGPGVSRVPPALHAQGNGNGKHPVVGAQRCLPMKLPGETESGSAGTQPDAEG